VRVAAERGLTHIAITDHERIDGARRARDAAPPGLAVIVGEEVRTSAGDMIGLYLDEPVPPGLSPEETAAAIRAQGGVVGIPHPFDRFRTSGLHLATAAALDNLARVADFLEIHNARVPFGDANVRAAQLAHRLGIPGVAASDAHSTIEVGVAYTIAPGPIDGPDDLRAALRSAEVVPGRASYVVRALTPFAKAVNAARGNRRVRGATAAQ
jgi:predicted metal-dependent phosphoesterase TrpH